MDRIEKIIWITMLWVFSALTAFGLGGIAADGSAYLGISFAWVSGVVFAGVFTVWLFRVTYLAGGKRR